MTVESIQTLVQRKRTMQFTFNDDAKVTAYCTPRRNHFTAMRTNSDPGFSQLH